MRWRPFNHHTGAPEWAEQVRTRFVFDAHGHAPPKLPQQFSFGSTCPPTAAGHLAIWSPDTTTIATGFGLNSAVNSASNCRFSLTRTLDFRPPGRQGGSVKGQRQSDRFASLADDRHSSVTTSVEETSHLWNRRASLRNALSMPLRIQSVTTRAVHPRNKAPPI